MATILTGTTQGLGAELQKVLYVEDRDLVVINRRPSGQPNELVYDLSSPQAVQELQKLLLETATDKNILFVLNAALYGEDETVSDVSPEAIATILYTNVFAQLSLVEALLTAGKKVRLAAVSSSMGSISLASEPYHYVYGASKASLNLSVRLLSKQYDNLSYLLMDPGWMQTQMGGEGATDKPVDVAHHILTAIYDDSKWNNDHGMLEVNSGKTIHW